MVLDLGAQFLLLVLNLVLVLDKVGVLLVDFLLKFLLQVLKFSSIFGLELNKLLLLNVDFVIDDLIEVLLGVSKLYLVIMNAIFVVLN